MTDSHDDRQDETKPDEMPLTDLQPYLDAMHNAVAKLTLETEIPARLLVDAHDVYELPEANSNN